MIYRVLINKKSIYSEFLEDYFVDLMGSTFYIPDTWDFIMFKVTPEYIARPDLIAIDMYGDPMYADVICKLNGVSNPFELNEGQLLILPKNEYISDFVLHVDYGDEKGIIPLPQGMDSIRGKYSNTGMESDPRSNLIGLRSKANKKTKSDRRVPNEAIVGDARFKIDKVHGVVIY